MTKPRQLTFRLSPVVALRVLTNQFLHLIFRFFPRILRMSCMCRHDRQRLSPERLKCHPSQHLARAAMIYQVATYRDVLVHVVCAAMTCCLVQKKVKCGSRRVLEPNNIRIFKSRNPVDDSVEPEKVKSRRRTREAHRLHLGFKDDHKNTGSS